MGFEGQNQRARTDRQKPQVFLDSSSLQYPDNEKADSGTNDAVNNGRDLQFLLPSLDMKACWKGCLHEEFRAFCLETCTQKGINYFNKYYSKSTKQWFEAIRINRQVIVMINRLRSLKQVIVLSAVCDCGARTETVDMPLTSKRKI
jgi:hypothetical protein